MEKVNTFIILADKLMWLKEKFAFLNKKAAKLRCPEVSFTIIRDFLKAVPVESSVSLEDQISTIENGCVLKQIPHYEIEVNGEAPSLNGWSFVATLDHTENGNIIRGLEQVPERFKTTGRICEHCGKDRNRKDTYIIKHENGEYKQVGRSCLKDFLGHTDPTRLALYASYFDLIQEAEEYDGERTGGHHLIDPRTFLKLCALFIRTVGFVSRKVAENLERPMDTTKDQVCRVMFAPRGERDKFDWAQVIPEDINKAEAAVEWAKTLKNSTNQYEYNLALTALKEGLEWRDLGLAASLIAAYNKAHSIENYEKKEKIVSNYVGEVGKRSEMDVVFVTSIAYQTVYGVMYINKFRDVTGNALVWKSNNNFGANVAENKEYKIKATIKAHSDYRGNKQTEISRVVSVN